MRFVVTVRFPCIQMWCNKTSWESAHVEGSRKEKDVTPGQVAHGKIASLGHVLHSPLVASLVRLGPFSLNEQQVVTCSSSTGDKTLRVQCNTENKVGPGRFSRMVVETPSLGS